jgi:hypothetical protein
MVVREFEDHCSSICREWDEAELAVKIAEQVQREVVGPSIAELRYAGRKVVQAMSVRETEPDRAIRLLYDAEFDCYRARHDAIDAATSYMTDIMYWACKELGVNNVTASFSNFAELNRMLVSVRQEIAKSRKNREDRDSIYRVIQETDLPKMNELYGEFKASEEIIVLAAKQDRRVQVMNKIFGVVGILSLVLSIVFYFAG